MMALGIPNEETIVRMGVGNLTRPAMCDGYTPRYYLQRAKV